MQISRFCSFAVNVGRDDIDLPSRYLKSRDQSRYGVTWAVYHGISGVSKAAQRIQWIFKAHSKTHLQSFTFTYITYIYS